eukprot:COSAG05_NODE_5702_length_1112_cov_1.493583_1_plen_250_part_01
MCLASPFLALQRSPPSPSQLCQPHEATLLVTRRHCPLLFPAPPLRPLPPLPSGSRSPRHRHRCSGATRSGWTRRRRQASASSVSPLPLPVAHSAHGESKVTRDAGVRRHRRSAQPDYTRGGSILTAHQVAASGIAPLPGPEADGTAPTARAARAALAPPRTSPAAPTLHLERQRGVEEWGEEAKDRVGWQRVRRQRWRRQLPRARSNSRSSWAGRSRPHWSRPSGNGAYTLLHSYDTAHSIVPAVLADLC